MKVAELFAELFFKVTGKRDLEETRRAVKEVGEVATKAAFWINAMSAAALGAMVASSKSGMAMQVFGRRTNFSVEELQRWQAAAEGSGSSAEELAAAIELLNDTRTDYLLGQPREYGSWSLLGVDPTEKDPVKTLESLRKKVAEFEDVNVARNLVQRIGLGSLFPLLTSSTQQFERFKTQALVVKKEDVDRLARLNSEWRQVVLNLRSARNELAAAFTPEVERLFSVVEKGIQKLSDFSHWLTSGSEKAELTRKSLVYLAIGLGGLGVALTALAATLKATGLMLTLFDPAFWAKLGAGMQNAVGMFSRIASAISKAAQALGRIFPKGGAPGFLPFSREDFEQMNRDFEDRLKGKQKSVTIPGLRNPIPPNTNTNTTTTHQSSQNINITVPVTVSDRPELAGESVVAALRREAAFVYRATPAYV